MKAVKTAQHEKMKSILTQAQLEKMKASGKEGKEKSRGTKEKSKELKEKKAKK